MKDRPTNNSMLSASIALKEAGGRFLGPILDAIPLALAILDMNTTIVAVNRSFEKLSRLRKKEVEGVRSWTEFFLEEDVQWMREHHDSRRRDPSSAPNSYESHFINANGSVRTVSLRISMIPGTALSIAALSDITAKKHREERLVHQAFHDQLTGLPNRALLMDRLSHALSSAERDSNMIGVLLLDLDEFKRVNDTYGHPFGDSVLRSAAERIRNCLRKKDTVARIGGDEFVIIVDDAVDSRDLAQVANTIIQRFSSPFVVNGQTVYLGISIGIALYPADGDMPELLIKNADLAMYRSKQKGKNTFNLFTQDLDERLLERLTLENDLRQAILSDRFAVRYQPCLHADGKTVLGVQAVVRWYRSDGREVLPKEIFRLAQETGVAVPLERRILETACREAVPWVARFSGLRLFVKTCAAHIMGGNFLRLVSTTLAETGFPGDRLALVVETSSSLSDISRLKPFFEELAELGPGIVLEGVCTRGAPLMHLALLPVSILKIDLSGQDFVWLENGRPEPRLENLLTGVAALARSMNMELLASSVSGEKRLQSLAGLGYQAFQNDSSDSPLSHIEFQQLLNASKNSG